MTKTFYYNSESINKVDIIPKGFIKLDEKPYCMLPIVKKAIELNNIFSERKAYAINNKITRKVVIIIEDKPISKNLFDDTYLLIEKGYIDNYGSSLITSLLDTAIIDMYDIIKHGNKIFKLTETQSFKRNQVAQQANKALNKLIKLSIEIIDAYEQLINHEEHE